MKNKVIALLPARAGSKRLINKNILPIANKPLIAWTIEAALDVELFDDVIVSTDSDDIKNVALDFGASVPFKRPSPLSSDTATTDDVLMHAIKVLNLKSTDIIVLLQPTSPLRESKDIKEALLKLNDSNVQGVVSVCECEHSPLWSNILPESMLMGEFIRSDISSKRSQDLPCFYRLNGAIYAYRVSYLEKHNGRVYSNDIKAHIMPTSRSIDVDNLTDFHFAEFLLKRKIEKSI
ncbi:CMP-N-acetlyneuraminic acid synthetase [Vibrio furnissii]|uniref:CMP-N-acetlyneuraminic acid synthetase n=1 Tax=Vibrio furnissii TaxID=29494 RepID=A0A0Q2MVB2_VIBFU|nr:acylneuraminate cytidylyltransferase family protein [Vibrio furnissii]KQH83647.1 CMP-N-acetlyneuraminic acid synthetase [Vibrio furnissii]